MANGMQNKPLKKNYSAEVCRLQVLGGSIKPR